MKRLGLISLCALMATPLWARPPLDEQARMAFRKAVARYQIFVIPICTPDIVRAYFSERAERDRLFVKSLRGTELATDYKRAIADEAARVRRTVYHCSGPPPPPGYVSPKPIRPDPPKPDPRQTHFEGGDKQFDELVRLRDSLIGRARL